MSDLRMPPGSLGWILLLTLLMGCNLPQIPSPQIDEQDAEQSISSIEAPTRQPEQSTTETETAAPPPGESSAPSTVTPSEVGDTLEVPSLASGTELTIVEIKMLDAETGWALGGTATDSRRIVGLPRPP